MSDPVSFEEATQIVHDACNAVGFTPPQPDDTIVDWAMTALDHALAPKGSERWREGHDALMRALNAALVGAHHECIAAVKTARALVTELGALACRCPLPYPQVFHDPLNRPFCARCHLRRRNL